MKEFFDKAVEQYGKEEVIRLIKIAGSKEKFYKIYNKVFAEKEREKKVNPPITLIYGLPKSGKTAICQELTKQCKCKVLCNDKAGWSAYTTPITELPDDPLEMFSELKTELSILTTFKNDYEKVIIDNITELDEASYVQGTWDYMNSVVGKKFNRDENGKILPRDKWACVTKALSMGGGWAYPREVMLDLFNNYIRPLSYEKDVIIIGHIKDKDIEDDGGRRIDIKKLNVTGKTADLVMSKCDAVCLFQRSGKEGILNMSYGKDTVAGSRYYRGEKIVISKATENGIETYWDQFYK